MLKSLRLAVLAACGIVATATTAEAHAVLVESSPPAKSEVMGGKVEFHLRYNSRIDVKRSRLSLKGPDGTKSLAPQPGKTEAEVITRAEGLAPGRYVLYWDVLSVDGHVSRGDVPFVTINP
jgi:copper resistance protein C